MQLSSCIILPKLLRSTNRPASPLSILKMLASTLPHTTPKRSQIVRFTVPSRQAIIRKDILAHFYTRSR